MKKVVVVVALPLLVGGCALPMSVRIASWAVDGISYLATEKSLTDHMLSAVTNQDCAVWRTLQGNDVCIDTSDEIQVAAADVAEATGEKPVAAGAMVEAPVEAAPTEDLTKFETAAGGAEEALPSRSYTATETYLASLPLPSLKPASVPVETQLAGLPRHETDELPQQMIHSDLVYVIGSYATMEEAALKAQKFSGLRPTVVHRPMDGGMVYRLVVGFSKADQKDVRGRLVRAGVHNLWAARFEQDSWPVVSATELAKAAGAEVADVRF
ncbi:hypothetical protein JCM17960_19350 [Magnetospira thiophila]